MTNSLAPTAGGPQTKSDFGIISAATACIQDTLSRGRNTAKNIVIGTKNSLFNVFK